MLGCVGRYIRINTSMYGNRQVEGHYTIFGPGFKRVEGLGL